jgi:hypothetical protein
MVSWMVVIMWSNSHNSAICSFHNEKEKYLNKSHKEPIKYSCD